MRCRYWETARTGYRRVPHRKHRPAARRRVSARACLHKTTSPVPGRCTEAGTDIVLGDDDGVVFIASDQAGEVLATARQIAQAERDQARKIQAGQTLRQQTTFGEYLARRAAEPSYTFRRHLRQIGGAIEE